MFPTTKNGIENLLHSNFSHLKKYLNLSVNTEDIKDWRPYFQLAKMVITEVGQTDLTIEQRVEIINIIGRELSVPVVNDPVSHAISSDYRMVKEDLITMASEHLLLVEAKPEYKDGCMAVADAYIKQIACPVLEPIPEDEETLFGAMLAYMSIPSITSPGFHAREENKTINDNVQEATDYLHHLCTHPLLSPPNDPTWGVLNLHLAYTLSAENLTVSYALATLSGYDFMDGQSGLQQSLSQDQKSALSSAFSVIENAIFHHGFDYDDEQESSSSVGAFLL